MKDPLNPEFVAALCHDLRGPLGALGTWIHVLNSGRADEASRVRALAAMTGDVRSLGTLIEQFSSLGAALAGAEQVSLEPVDLVPFLEHIIGAARASGGVEASLQCPETSFTVPADPVRLRRAIFLFVSDTEGAPIRAREVTLRRQEGMAEIAIHVGERPKLLSVALARALVEAQGGELSQTMPEGNLYIRLPIPD